MFKTFRLLVPVIALMLVIAGCSTDKNPMDTQLDLRTANYAIPPGATIESATFYVDVLVPSDQKIGVYRATDMWMEATATWNNTASDFASPAEGSFYADAAGWKTVDLTALVTAWVDGTYPNYGVMLIQDSLEYPRTFLGAIEEGRGAWLEVCYSVDGGATMCDTVMPLEDASIYEAYPDSVQVFSNNLTVGRYAEGLPEKRSLVKYEFETQPPPELAGIGDFVWYDSDMDGIQDDGEMGVGGVTVHLMDCEGNILAETTTDATGFYQFVDLEPGDYSIHFVIPTGYVLSPQDQGADDALDSDADMDGFTICTTLDAGEYDPTWDMGIYQPMQEGCTHTIGYWMNWTGLGPQPDMVSQYLPIWLGTPGGDESIAVTDVEIAVEIFGRMGSNGIGRLQAQLLGTKLSIADGASDTDLGDAIMMADQFLAEHSFDDWYDLSRQDKNMVNQWKDLFDAFNNGCIGPGHCDGEPATDCDEYEFEEEE